MKKVMQSCVVLLSLFGFSSAVFATDDKVFSGNDCMPYYHSQADDIYHYASSMYNNNSTYNRSVACPVTRDNIQNTNGTVHAFVRYNRSSSTTNSLSCTLFNYTTTGTVTAWDSNSTTANSGSLPLDLDSSNTLGHYSIYCSVPPYSRIYSYRVGEYADTSTN